MELAKTKATTVAAVALIAGVAAGGMLAMATPTRMSRQAENWRDMIGVRKVAVNDGGIPIYAPPQDTTPVNWQSAAQEYPALPPQDDHWVDVSNDVLPDVIPDLDDSYQPNAAAEVLPAELMESRGSSPDLVSLDDAAASADAAQAAAADVRKQENAAVEPSAPAMAPAAASSQADTSAT